MWKERQGTDVVVRGRTLQRSGEHCGRTESLLGTKSSNSILGRGTACAKAQRHEGAEQVAGGASSCG